MATPSTCPGGSSSRRRRRACVCAAVGRRSRRGPGRGPSTRSGGTLARGEAERGFKSRSPTRARTCSSANGTTGSSRRPMTERRQVSVFDEVEMHRLRAAGFQEVEIVRDEAGHESLILVRQTPKGWDMSDFIREQAKVIGGLGGTWMMHGETGEYGQGVGLDFFQ